MSYVWWLNITGRLKELAKGCDRCQIMPIKAPLHPFEWATAPWQRLHIDYAGSFQNLIFLVVVDVHRKCLEVIPVSSTTTSKTIEVLRDLFARFGIPELIVSDNSPQLASEEFQAFIKSNGIPHITSAPYHPATNGLAEKLVQTFKQALRSMFQSSKPVKEKLTKFLIAYRNTPHSTTGESPAQLLLGRPLRTRLDLVKPNLNRKMVNQQHQQGIKGANEKGRQRRQLEVGDAVMSRDYPGDVKWRSGLIVKKTSPLTYEVQVTPGIIWRRHMDQLGPTAVEPTDVQGVEPDTVAVGEAEVVSLPPVATQKSAPPNIVGTVPQIPVVDQPEMVSVLVSTNTNPPDATPASPAACERG